MVMLESLGWPVRLRGFDGETDLQWRGRRKTSH